jgi:hypothetical protein
MDLQFFVTVDLDPCSSKIKPLAQPTLVSISSPVIVDYYEEPSFQFFLKINYLENKGMFP